MTEQDRAGVAAPPPAIFLSFLLVALALHYLWLPLHWGVPEPLRRGMAAVLFGAGLSLILSAAGVFTKAGTNVRPWKPTTALVLEGPYRWTRNPMYVGMACLYLCGSLVADSLIPIFLLGPLVATMNWGVIEREERYLEGKFGEPYRRYREQVRRWL